LDGITEGFIMDAIHDFSGKKTIVMIAHRLSTVKRCDTIFLIKNGKVEDHGSYNELARKNVTFEEMSKHS
jgi:HlyD family secretion protein